MPHTPLIEMTRGGTLESQYFGSVAVVDTQGRLRAIIIITARGLTVGERRAVFSLQTP